MRTHFRRGAFIWLNLYLLCQVLSIGFGKQASLSMSGFSTRDVLSNWFYLLSLLCLGLQALVWPLALRRYTLSFAYAYMSLNYVVILVMSVAIFHERVTVPNVMGAALILVGVNVLFRDDAGATHV